MKQVINQEIIENKFQENVAVEVQDPRFQVDPWVKMGNSEIMD